MLGLRFLTVVNFTCVFFNGVYLLVDGLINCLCSVLTEFGGFLMGVHRCFAVLLGISVRGFLIFL